MAGAFSGHLLDAFNNAPAQSAIVTSGVMSFDARAHGTPAPSLSGFTPFSEDSDTAKRIATLQAKLNKKLGPEYVSQRPGPGGGPKLTYAEGWKIINLANEVFGFNGWSSSIVSIVTDFIDYNEESKKFNVGVTAIVRVTLRDGAYHEDVGYGMLENGKSKAAALDKCKKEAITDALKRTLRNFGNLLGNCLYDKAYAQEVVKIKVPPVKFDKNELYRRPEFEERISDASAPPPNDQASAAFALTTRHDEPRVKVEREGKQPEAPITYVPRHLRQEVAAAQQARVPVTPPQRAQTHVHARTPTLGSGSGSNTSVAPATGDPPPINAPKATGLATPVQTPSRGQRPPPPQATPLRAVATSPLARIASAPECSMSEPVPVPIRAGSADTADQTVDRTDQVHRLADDDDDDAFHMSTQDGEFFATVDLGEGDFGRPIDFDEGLGGVSTNSELDIAELSPAILAQPQVRERVGSSSSAGPSSSGFGKANMRNEAGVQSAARRSAESSASGGQSQSSRGVPLNTADASTSTRAGLPARDSTPARPTMTSMGGFHFPLGKKPHTPKPVVPACVRTSSSPQSAGPPNANASALKRNADMMHAGSGSSMRPPIQGMGLSKMQQEHQQRNAGARRPSDASSTSEGHDPKRLKH